MDMDCDASEVVKTLDDLLSIVEGKIAIVFFLVFGIVRLILLNCCI